jgi:uncharacterized repeat protein (TIGR01451 family)
MSVSGHAAGLSPQVRARLAAGQSTWVIVEFNADTTNQSATAERARRHLPHDDSAILDLRARGYGTLKSAVRSAVAAPDAASVRDYQHFPLALWRISTLDALQRLQARPEVRAVHENKILHAVSVSDLPFINQPQAAAEGAIGAGTTIAVIDGGLGTNYESFPDFGTCTAVGTPASTCRLVYNVDYFGNSAETIHGTNVSAIALGVAPGAKLAMFDVFSGAQTSSDAVTQALNDIIGLRSTYNIVAVNMSLGDGSSNPGQCAGSLFAPQIQAAADVGIVSVVAAGNNGSKTGLADPACVPGVVSVGAVYNAAYGSPEWPAAAISAGVCTDSSAADLVTCFSQSSSYLSILAPGTFVNAPSSAFQESGTSQATPHVTGAVAVLRARYPAESASQILQRMQLTGVKDTDPGNGLALPRLNLLAAANLGTAVSIAGSGPTQAVAGQTGTYLLTLTNQGPLAATNVVMTDTLPSIAQFVSASSGCVFNYPDVSCPVGNLAVGGSITFTITVKWSGSGAIYNNATVAADQGDTSRQTVSIGTPPSSSGDAPLPAWAYALLGMGLFGMSARERRRHGLPRPQPS